MKKLTRIFAAIMIFGATVTPALAEGVYGALDAGQTKAADACTGAPAGCKDTATLYRIAIGGQFNPMFGMELSYADYGKANIGTAGPVTADWHLTGEQLSVIGGIPLGDVFAITGKVGAARTSLKISANTPGGSASTTANTTNLAWGLGVLFNINKSFAIRAQYEDLGKVGDAATTGTTKVTLMSAGVMFRF